MFIKRNRTRFGGKGYQSILLVQGKRVPAKRGPGRPAAGAPPPKSVVVHETLANLSKLPPELIELIDRHCKHQPQLAEASGLPVAAYPVPGPIDVINGSPVGFLNEDLASAARNAVNISPGLCRDFALQFSWRRSAEQFLSNLKPFA